MSRFTLMMALASTLLTPVAVHAEGGAEQPRAQNRAARQQARQAIRGPRGPVARRSALNQIQRQERRVDRRFRRSERRIDRRFRQSERQIDRRVAPRLSRVDRRLDRRDDLRLGRGRIGRWNRDWRLDRRYDIRRYRLNNQRLFRLNRYDPPFSRRYSRLGVGARLAPGYFGNRYLLADPFRYRLPPTYGDFRWARYFNDAVLVDTRTGLVRDVEYDLFY